MRRKTIIFFLFFITVLCWFYYGNPWYPEARLVISGNYSKEAGKIVVRWDSGNDLNGYEMKRFSLQPVPSTSDDECEIEISKSGNGQHGSKNSKVIIKSVHIDGKQVALDSLRVSDDVVFDNGLLSLKTLGSSFSFSAKPQSQLQFELLTYNYAGDAIISVCGNRSEYTLYSSNDLNKWSLENTRVIENWYRDRDGSFEVSLNLPRYRINNILLKGTDEYSVHSLKIIDEFGNVLSGPEPIKAPIGLVYQLSDLDGERLHRFHPHLLIWQIVFAAITTLILWIAVNYLLQFNGIRDVFLGHNRPLFWGMFCFGLLVFSFWHIAFWPGIASTDSLKIWRAAHIPGTYLGDHPPLNVLFYQYLSQFWDNTAVVPIFQNVVCSLLVSSIFFSCFRWGVPIYLVALFYLLTIFSVPVGLYNAVLWKDVPFAFLTVYLAFKLADMYFRIRYDGVGRLQIDWGILLAVLLLLVGTRYNGAVYLLLVPCLLIVLRIVRIRWRYILSAACVLFLFTVLGLAVFKDRSPVSYFTMQSTKYIQQAIGEISPEFAQEKFNKYKDIFNVNQKYMQWDHLHDCFWWRYNNVFLTKVGWNDTYPYLPLPRSEIQKKISGLAVNIYKISYKPPWVYFSWNPVYLLYLLLAVPLLIRWLPMSAVFSVVILSQVLALVFLDILNWRYYYFAFLGLNFLVPLMIADRTRLKTMRTTSHAL